MKLAIINKNLRVYIGRADDEDELVFVLTGLSNYEANTVTLEIASGHQIAEAIEIDSIESLIGLDYDEDASNENIFVFRRR